MRRQHRSFLAMMIIVSLCCGFIGCKSNGGRWYKPTSYSWHNPFKRTVVEEDEYGMLADDSNGIRLPKENQTPELDTPAGGYSRNANTVATNANPAARTGVPAPATGYYGSAQPQANPAVAMNGGVQQTTYNPQQYQTQAPAVNQQQYYNPAPQNTAAMQNVNPNYGAGYQQPNAATYQNPYPPQPTNQQYNTAPAQYAPTQDAFGAVQPSTGYATGQNQYSTTAVNDYSSEYRPGSR